MRKTYRKQYDLRKKMVLNILKSSMEHYEKFYDKEKFEVLQELYTDLENGSFSIVVVGEFSAGKSTFLNALMGEKYLPSFSTETTATVNFIKSKDISKDGNEISIQYKDGSLKKINKANFEQLKKYVTTKSDIDVVKEIKSVDLYLDSNFLKEGVILVDSPGLNGVEEGHREITEKQIEKSHACIFLFDANQPGRKTEFEFLVKLKEKVNTILFVLNKIDEIKENEQTLQDVENDLKKNYKKFFSHHFIPEIWSVASYPALVARGEGPFHYRGKLQHTEEEKSNYLKNSRLEAFEDRLWRFLTQGEKAKQELISPLEKVRRILALRKKELENEIHQLHSSTRAEEIRNELDYLENEIQHLKISLQEKHGEILEELNIVMREIKENIKSKAQNLKEKYLRIVNDWTELEEIEGNIEELNAKVQKDFLNLINKVYEEFLDDFQEVIRIKYKEYSTQVQESIHKHVKYDDVVVLEVCSTVHNQDVDIVFGFEEYERKLRQYDEELDKIENQLYDTIDKSIQSKILLHEKADIQNKIYSLKERQEKFQSILGTRPTKRILKILDTQKESRGGILGTMADVLVGKRYITKEKIELDDSEQIEFDRYKREIEEKYKSEEEMLLEVLDGLEDVEKTPEQYKIIEERLQRLRNYKAKEMEEYRKEYKEKFQKRYHATLNKVKSNFCDYIEEVETVAEMELYKKIKMQKDVLTEMVIDIINENIIKDIEKKKEIRTSMMNKLESSIEEKDRMILQCESEINSIDEILQKTISLYTEIAQEKADEIKKERISSF